MDYKVTQNFLTNARLVEELLTRTNITSSDTVLDIGSGDGIITEALIKKAGNIIAFEVDSLLYEKLETKFRDYNNIKLLNVDFLNHLLPKNKYKVFSNIPFNISADIMNYLFFGSNAPESAYIIMQEAAANRFCGLGEGVLWSMLIQPFYRVSIMHKFKKSDFTPEPAVEIAMFRAEKRISPLLQDKYILMYRDFVSYLLLQQKTSLKKRVKKIFLPAEFYTECTKLKIKPEDSANNLSVEQWIGLFSLYENKTQKSNYRKQFELVRGSFKKYLQYKNDQPTVHRTHTFA